MATLTATWDFRVTLGGEEIVLASPSVPPTLSLSTLQKCTTTLATSTNATIFQPNVLATPGAFDFFYYLGDQDAYLELTCNNTDANERVFAVPAKANFPFVLWRDDAFYNFTAGPSGNALAGVLDVIDLIRVYQTSGSTMTYTYAAGQT
jgi:hypothetical protein